MVNFGYCGEQIFETKLLVVRYNIREATEKKRYVKWTYICLVNEMDFVRDMDG